MCRGGSRQGAGRPKGAKDKATRDAGATIGELARAHAEDAIQTLVQVAKSGASDSARVAAANALLDRGFGRPPQALEHTGKNGGPIEAVKMDKEDYKQARKEMLANDDC